MTAQPEQRTRLSSQARWSLVIVLFNAICAIAGAVMMWTAPDTMGFGSLLPLMQQHLPLIGKLFTSFALPGALLLVIIGLPHLWAAVLIARDNFRAPLFVIIVGILLTGWTLLQLLIVFGPNMLSFAFLIIGLLETNMGTMWANRLARQAAKN